MIKKILISIIVCTLAIPSSFALANDNDNTFMTVNNNYNVPTWSMGDSWTYGVDISPTSGVLMTLDGKFTNLKMIVVNVEGLSYELDIAGDITGEMIFNLDDTQISGNVKDATIVGSMTVDSSNLGTKQMELIISGKIVVALIPIPLTIELSITYSPSYDMIDFPLSVGKKWIGTKSDVQMRGRMKIGDKIDREINSDTFVGGEEAEVKQLKTINVEAGSYEAYEIESDQELSTIYYSTEAGYIVKAYGNSFYYFDSVDMNLLSTTYTGGGGSNAPNKPSRPSGAGSGKPDNSYDFSSSTTDNQGDLIYYMLSWGDGDTTEWLGPYESGETVTASHSWSSEGSYEIKVIAKDDNGHQSSWSDPKTLSITKSKNRFPFAKIIDFLLDTFPRMEILIELLNTI